MFKRSFLSLGVAAATLSLCPDVEARIGVTDRSSLGGLCAETLNWIRTVYAAGGTVSPARRQIVNTLIVGLQQDGIWTLLDRLWTLAAENSTSALIDLKGLATATATNSPTFTANQGYAGNGTTSYIESNWAPTTGPNYVQNSAHLSAYVRTNRTTGLANATQTGVFGTSNVGNSQIGVNPPSSTVLRINQNGAWGPGAQPSTTQGYHILTRTGSGGTAGDFFINGASQGITTSSASNGVTSRTLTIGVGQNFGGYVTDQIAVITAGAGLNSTQATNLSTRINAYMTALGTNVY